MKDFATFLFLIVISIVSAIGVYNYAPIGLFDYLPTFEKEKPLGATITTILGTDTLKDSRAVINTNFSNLNTDKIEVATTSVGNITALPGLTTANALTSASSLATVGTITTGRWNGIPILSAYGGTGTTTFPAYHVIVASSTGAGLMSVSGLGTSGQFLTSQGAGTFPQWTTSSVDLGIDYNWTGRHTFNTALLRTASSSDLIIASTTVGRLIATTTVNFTGATITGLGRASSTTWSSTNTYTKSSGVVKIYVQAFGGGASGGKGSNNAGGGGGGTYFTRWLNASQVGATETVTIGAGGVARSTDANGAAGGNTTFGSLVTAQGGTGGGNAGAADVAGGDCGNPQGTVENLWGAGVSANAGQNGLYCGAGGGANNTSSTGFVGGNATYGGAGGGGIEDSGTASSGAGGTSTYGGNGGAAGGDASNGTAGSVPGGGGGAGGPGGNSGAGGDGQMIVTEFF